MHVLHGSADNVVATATVGSNGAQERGMEGSMEEVKEGHLAGCNLHFWAYYLKTQILKNGESCLLFSTKKRFKQINSDQIENV